MIIKNLTKQEIKNITIVSINLIDRIILFGSRATNNFSDNSDHDLKI